MFESTRYLSKELIYRFGHLRGRFWLVMNGKRIGREALKKFRVLLRSVMTAVYLFLDVLMKYRNIAIVEQCLLAMGF